MRVPALEFLPFDDIPELHRAILAGGRDDIAAAGNSGNRGCMGGKPIAIHAPACPTPTGRRPVAGDELLAIGREAQRRDPIGVLLHLANQGAIARRENFTSRLGPPRATRLWSGLISAASTVSNSSPISAILLPVTTSQITTCPSFAPTPPPAIRSLPLWLKRTICGNPSGNGRMPASSSESVL